MGLFQIKTETHEAAAIETVARAVLALLAGRAEGEPSPATAHPVEAVVARAVLTRDGAGAVRGVWVDKRQNFIDKHT